VLLPLSASGSIGITGLDVSPDPFSPTGDGVRDSTVVSFNLTTDHDAAYIWITVTDNEDQTVIRLAEAEPNEPGVIEKVWLGQTSTGDPAPDGIYTFEVKGKVDSESTGVVARSVFLDTTAPIIEDVRPHPAPYTPMLPMKDTLLTVDMTIANAHDGDWLSAVMTLQEQPEELCTIELLDADTTYSCQWDGREKNDGIYTLEVRTYDPAGNSAQSSHSVDLDLQGPTLTVDYPTAHAMTTFPDSVAGTVFDRNGADWVLFRFKQGTDYLEATIPDPDPCCPIEWFVKWPDSLKEDGTFNLEVYAADVPGYESKAFHEITIATAPPEPPEISAPPGQVSSPQLILTGQCSAGDSLFIYLNGVVERSMKCSAAGTFSITLTLERGENSIYAISKDVAGNYSAPSETVRVEYIEEMGIRVPEKLDAETTIEINLTKEVHEVILRVFSVGGSHVGSVVKESPSQFDEITWDLTDSDGKPVKNGPYVLTFEIKYLDGTTSTDRKAVIVVR
jgi:hypothetical protein